MASAQHKMPDLHVDRANERVVTRYHVPNSAAALAAQAAKKQPDLSAWLTRWEASEMLRCTEATVCQMEARGELHARKRPSEKRTGPEMVSVYDPREVARLAGSRRVKAFVRTPGEISGRAFELLDEGKSLRELVVALRVTPDEAISLKVQWEDMGGADRVINDVAKRELTAALGEGFETPGELVELVKAMRRECDELAAATRSPQHPQDASPTAMMMTLAAATRSPQHPQDESPTAMMMAMRNTTSEQPTIEFVAEHESALARASAEQIEVALVRALEHAEATAGEQALNDVAC